MSRYEDLKCVRVKVSGRVQGVGFRYFTHREAVSLGLGGYVRNLPDGSVEAVAEGSPETVDLFVEKLSSGPPASKVTGISVSEGPPGSFRNFEIRL